ncbi:MAG: FAD-dependent oxidoreductase [Verrucomicrobiales bacterium]|nr:FAD-dependent oxidoreductase [Verrucomicrobiales bacterium]
MPAQRHILIAGGGVIGLTTAYFLLQKGHRVTVVERGPRLHDCCSRHNAGMIVPSHFIPLAAPGAVSLALRWMWNPESPLYIKPRLDWDLITWGLRFMRSANAAHVARSAPLLRDLSLASRGLFEEFAALPDNDFGLVRRGLLMLCRTQHALDDETKTAARSRELGIPAEVLDARQTAALEPDVTMNVAGSVYFPKDCHLAPDRFLDRMAQAVERLGGELVWDTEIRGWKTRGNHIEALRTASGDRSADDYVLCGGSWSPTVAKDLGLRLPTQAGKGYSVTVPKPRQLPKICAIFTEARIAITPIGSSLRFGGTMEIAGLNEEINPVRVRGIVKAVPNYYPQFKVEDFDGIQPWRGLRPVSPDGMPYLGRSARFDNLGIATGHAMMGLSLAPITGKLMAQIMSNERPEIDVSALAPERFG